MADMHAPARFKGFKGPAGGWSTVVQAPNEWRASTAQSCGLWPFSVGAGTPMIGVPMGQQLFTGSTLCCDPINWFMRAHLISNPSAFVLGKPGLGKSTVIRRWAVGYAHQGVITMFLGDVKGEHVPIIKALGGQVITLGPGIGSINVLDPGGALHALDSLTGKLREELHNAIHTRRRNMLRALITISRGTSPTQREGTIMDRALRVLDDRFATRSPLMSDLLGIIREAPQEVRAVALDRGDDARYRDITENLESSLIDLSGSGDMGDMFSNHTSVQIDPTRPVVFDIHAINEVDQNLRAAALMACWDAGFAAVDANHYLARQGVAPLRHYFLVLDELWSALRSGSGMVDRVDQVTRLNRTFGVGQALITHTMSDLESLAEPQDRMKAKGFVERSGMVLCGGLPEGELPLLNQAISVSRVEMDLLKSWSDPGAWDERSGVESDPPGRGKFLVKVGGRPGIPFHLKLTGQELDPNDTNLLWHAPRRTNGREAEHGIE
ncbi:ATPase [Bifidobacterium crudilactis]|jgi:hypothetical protein|uniref:ATPase n=1 Tax=Bifidobacterium crudilactis TaxID=327277 RepID=UPI0023528CFA|nr:ATPase [Bifidobacterium crudilactis]MCI1889061.1 ATPase [Bifidobacterium crudilactis]MCI2156895.1 ATPase [Bifidobacterium crudilactis]